MPVEQARGRDETDMVRRAVQRWLRRRGRRGGRLALLLLDGVYWLDWLDWLDWPDGRGCLVWLGLRGRLLGHDLPPGYDADGKNSRTSY
jgi:hypothetical protein